MKKSATPELLERDPVMMLVVLLCVSYYLIAGLAINLGYHRCLSHRSFRLRKWLERGLITVGLPAGTPIQWVGTHRFHHRHADQASDPHSPQRAGFWYAHVGWYIDSRNAWICLSYSLAGPLRTLYDGWNRPRTNQEHNLLAPDVSADAYYRFISRPIPFQIACTLHLALTFAVAYLVGGLSGLATVWITSIVVYNIGDSIDSFAHLSGQQPCGANNCARNNLFLGYLALGEGWHANHHAFPESARHGLSSGQFDWTWVLLRLLKQLGLARDLIVISPRRIQQKLRG